MNNSIIIGQYVPGDSIIHRLDPRTKIIVIFFFVIIVFFANNRYELWFVNAFVVYQYHHNFAFQLRFILKGLTPVWFLIVFTFFLHLFLTKEGPVVFEFWRLKFHSRWNYSRIGHFFTVLSG